MTRSAPRAGRTGATLGAVAVLVLACGLHVSACKDDGTHAYLGRLYVEGRGCLGTTSSLDAISGGEPGDCAAICLAHPNAEGGRAIYVATMCGPYPYGFDTSGADPACPKALAALARNDTCLSTGGTTHPPVVDAGAD